MQTASHLQTSPKTCVALAGYAAESSALASSLLNDSTMHRSATTTASRPPLSSNNTTPTSTRRSSLSSFDHSNGSSASSDISAKRSPMKTQLKTSKSVGAGLNRRSAPPTVRFLDPEPTPRRVTEPGKTASLSPSSKSQPVRPGYTRDLSTPNLGPHQYRQKKIMIATLTRPPLLSPSSKRASTSGTPGEVRGSSSPLSPTQARTSGPATQLRQRADKRFSAPPARSHADPRLDPRWSGIPLPAGFVPPNRTSSPPQRTTSYHSIVSTLSASTVPSVTTTSTSNSYDAMQNYIPCMAAMCAAHYTPAHAGPTYYAAQEPYHLSKHHGYCPRHASKEMQEANALCKKEYESMRQSAGRKTLGVIAQDFEIFLHLYREARQVEDMRLQKAQRLRVLAPAYPISTKQIDGFDWRYTPRNCTKRGCASALYSPFATQYFGFYNTPNSSTQLLPLTTLCPSCSKAESEGFGAKLMEKWSSRCGWDGEEWDGWYQNAIQARRAEQEYWEKAQERVVRERLAKTAKSIVQEAAAPVENKEAVDQVETVPKKAKRKSVFKRMFRRSETTGAVDVADAAAQAK